MIKDKVKRNAYMNSYMKDRYLKRRSIAIQSLGGVCIQCGAKDNLEIDHKDPKSKFKTLSKLSSASEAIFQEELTKCQLLCKDCHLTKTVEEGSLSNRYSQRLCDCGQEFSTIKQYAGHKRHCKR